MNDINGFAAPSLYDQLADYQGRLVLMHAIQSKGIATRQDAPEGDIWAHIYRFFGARLEALVKAGVAQDKITLDPGMGFFLGNKPDTSLAVLAWTRPLKGRVWPAGAGLCVAQEFFARAIGCQH